MKMSTEIITGDCLVEMPKLIERGLIFDACITDPPFETTAAKWDVIIPLAPMWANSRLLTKPTANHVLFAAEPFTSLLIVSNLPSFKYDIVWRQSNSTGHLNCEIMPLRQHQSIVVFGDGQGTYNPQMSLKPSKNRRTPQPYVAAGSYGKYREDAERTAPEDEAYPRSVIDFSTAYHAREAGLHPNQKPIELMRYLIRTFTNEGDTVLDFACGSGSTGVACMIENRNFIGIEKDESYAEIARARISRAQGIACDIPKRERPHKPTPLFDEQVA